MTGAAPHKERQHEKTRDTGVLLKVIVSIASLLARELARPFYGIHTRESSTHLTC